MPHRSAQLSSAQRLSFVEVIDCARRHNVLLEPKKLNKEILRWGFRAVLHCVVVGNPCTFGRCDFRHVGHLDSLDYMEFIWGYSMLFYPVLALPPHRFATWIIWTLGCISVLADWSRNH